MKTIVKKSGQKIVVTDALYESIVKNGLMEDSNPINPGQSGANPQGNVSNTLTDIDKNIAYLYIQGDAKAYNDIQKHPEIIEDIKKLMKKYPNEELSKIVASYKENNTKNLQSTKQNINAQINEELKNDIINYIDIELDKIKEDNSENLPVDNKGNILSAEDLANEFISRYGKKYIKQNSTIEKLSHWIDKFIESRKNVKIEGIDKDTYNKYHKELESKISTYISTTLRSRVSKDIQEYSKDIETRISNYFNDSENKNNVKRDSLGNQIIKMFFSSDNCKPIANEISTDLMATFENHAMSRFTSEKISNADMRKVIANMYLNREDARDSKEMMDFYDNVVDKYVYSIIHKRLTSEEFIRNSELKTDGLDNKFVKSIIDEVDQALREIIINGNKGNYKGSGAVNLSKEMTSAEIDNLWDIFSKNVLNEKALNPLDDLIVDSYKRLIYSIDNIKETEINKDISAFSDRVNIEGGNIKNISPEKKSISVKKTLIETIKKFKKKTMGSYNTYRRKGYDYTMDIIENIKFNNKLCDELFDEYEKNKNIFKINDVNDCNKIFNMILKKYIINKKVNESYLFEDDKNIITDEKKNVAEKLVMAFSKMDMIYNTYFSKKYKNIQDILDKKNLSIKNIDILLNNLNAIFDDARMRIIYTCGCIMDTLTVKFKEYVSKKYGYNIENEKYENISELEKFKMLMGRYPTKEDLKLYEQTYNKLNNAISIFDKNINDYKRDLESRLFFPFGKKYMLGDYMIFKDKNLNHGVLNTIDGDTSIPEETINFLTYCLAYMHLSNAYREIDKKKKNGYEQLKSTIKDILGGTQITESDICKLFANVTVTNPEKVSANGLITILQSLKSDKNIKFIRTQIPAAFYTSQSIVMINGENEFIGCITYLSFDKLRDLFRGKSKWVKSIFNFIKRKR